MTDAPLPPGRVVVVSPHLDDAILSLGATIGRSTDAGVHVEVLTVFGNDPGSPAPARKWDVRCGFATEGEAAAARREEDLCACSALGAVSIPLPFRDGDYVRRRPESRSRKEICGAVARVVAGADAVLLPGFPLHNPDHLWLTRVLLAHDLPVERVGLYAEQPYRHKARRVRPLGLSPELEHLVSGALEWRQIAGGESAIRRKQAALQCYRSQLPHLGLHGRHGQALQALLASEERAGGEALAWLPHGDEATRAARRGRRSPRLVMTLLVRDESDVIGDQIDFHLAAGVDFVVATDHDSTDGTTEILEQYERHGVLHLMRESGPRYHQSKWVTRMAHLAAVEFGADWVINSDADEFWWPSGGDLRTVLGAIPETVGVVQTFVRPFLPRRGVDGSPERMTVRLSPAAATNDPASPFRVNVRIVHRAAADVVVGTGNVEVTGAGLAALRGWAPIEVLHFPIRSFDQFERKFLTHYRTVGGGRGDHARAHRAAAAGRLRDEFDRLSVGPGELERGVADGSLAIDTRLRDALHALASAAPLNFPSRTAAERAGYAVDAAILAEGETMRLLRRADEVGQRVALLERRARRLTARRASR